MNREVGLGSHSLFHSSPIPNIVINHIVSVDVMHHTKKKKFCIFIPVVKFLPNCHF